MDHTAPPQGGPSLNRLAARASTHCLTGCAIGEILVLACVFGYGLTMRPLLRAGFAVAAATKLVLLADTASITVMEIVDNAI
ncbi:MAG TPA: hypothetical protein DDW98_09395, partial [Gammaproteobacteria bacterium]|nr:hypothetical protein [Gammaproteobacteria bacterium]